MCTDFNHARLLSDLSVLFNDQQTADVIFVVGENEDVFYAHKLLLWARCGSFQKYEQQFWRSRSNHGPLTFKYPQYQAAVFAAVLKYLYAGSVTLTETVLFDVLSLANELEVKSLAWTCEQFVKSSITNSNACSYLSQASVDADNRRIVEICNEHIKKHAFDCVKSSGWVSLSKPAVINLISSEDFCLEEDEVWRAVIRWAKHNANLQSEPAEWNQHDKAVIGKVLEGVIEHVKFLLIDSEVFAQEVEPSGVVPMELSLARYRTAAVPSHFGAASDRYGTDPYGRHLAPRVHRQFFKDSILLTAELVHFQRILNEWFYESMGVAGGGGGGGGGGSGSSGVSSSLSSSLSSSSSTKQQQSWTLLYRASRDGFRAADFHRCCDGHAPTLTIVAGGSAGGGGGGWGGGGGGGEPQSGGNGVRGAVGVQTGGNGIRSGTRNNTGASDYNLCGGFSDVAWSSAPMSPHGRFHPSRRAFVFTLRNKQAVPPTRFPVADAKLATIHHADYGPVFGAGADLCIADQCGQNMHSYSNLPHTYGSCGGGGGGGVEEDVASCSLLMGDYNFMVYDYEVFTPCKD